MRYLLLIYEAEDARDGWTEAQNQAMIADYFAYTQELKDAGCHLGGDALEPIATATTVRVRDGERLTTDGPFAETKEQLGGFYMIDCDNLDEALAWAAKIPTAKTGSIEVRPVWEFEW